MADEMQSFARTLSELNSETDREQEHNSCSNGGRD